MKSVRNLAVGAGLLLAVSLPAQADPVVTRLDIAFGPVAAHFGGHRYHDFHDGHRWSHGKRYYKHRHYKQRHHKHHRRAQRFHRSPHRYRHGRNDWHGRHGGYERRHDGGRHYDRRGRSHRG